MNIVTTISYDQFSKLIRDNEISLNNSELFFGYDSEHVNEYLRERVGCDGYVMGLRSKLNERTAALFATFDSELLTCDDKVIIEAKIDPDDVVRYALDGVDLAAQAVDQGLSEEAFRAVLAGSEQHSPKPENVEVLCIPKLRNNGTLRVASLQENLEIEVEGITFVKLFDNKG